MTREAQLLFTWSIPHADDVGLLPGSLKTLKAMIVPMWEMPAEQFDNLVTQILEQKLWQPFDFGGDSFFKVRGFTEHQTLKKDRQPQTLLKIEHKLDPKATWKYLEDIGFQLEYDDVQMELEVKGSKGKRSKVNKLTVPGDLLKRIKKTPPNPHVQPLMDFFYKAVKIIRNIDPPEVNTGKVGSIVKRRLEVDKIAPHRIECMTLWYLTREKRFKDNRDQWQNTFKYSPDMAVMLSDAFLSQLLSDEANIIIYMRDNFDYLDKIYKQIEPKKFLKISNVESIGQIIKRKQK